MPPAEARILVAEDEFPMRNVLNDLLTSQGYRVILAEDGEQALAKTASEKPDLILLDVMMPKVDGFSACARIRQLGSPRPNFDANRTRRNRRPRRRPRRRCRRLPSKTLLPRRATSPSPRPTAPWRGPLHRGQRHPTTRRYHHRLHPDESQTRQARFTPSAKRVSPCCAS